VTTHLPSILRKQLVTPPHIDFYPARIGSADSVEAMAEGNVIARDYTQVVHLGTDEAWNQENHADYSGLSQQGSRGANAASIVIRRS